LVAVVPFAEVALKRRRTGSQLLAYRATDGRHELTAEEVNAYLRHNAGDQFTAKDFRTWNATVLAERRRKRLVPRLRFARQLRESGRT
jgi:DNA topoisomerase-1